MTPTRTSASPRNKIEFRAVRSSQSDLKVVVSTPSKVMFQGACMLRREFVTLICSAAAWPFAVGAQPRTLPVVGVLSATAPAPGGSLDGVALFLRALAEMGYFDGQT